MRKERSDLLFDTHIHTRFSTDSTMLIEEALSKAQQSGLGIVLTEHMDLAYPGEPEAFVFNAEDYFAAYQPFRCQSVLLGVELGMRVDCLEDNRRLAAKYPFDFIIGSIHVVDDMDIYCAEFYQGKTKQAVYNQYLDAMIACMERYDFIHSLGHIDYIARYARFEDTELYYHEFQDRLDRVLTLVAEAGKALEINTRRLDSKERIEAVLPIYRRFAELGGQLVTIGSDAHKAADVGRRLEIGMEIAAACGLQAVRFQAGKCLEIG